MKELVQDYKEKLQHEIIEAIGCPITSGNLRIAEDLGRVWMLYDDIWCKLDSYKSKSGKAEYMPRLTVDDIQHWNAEMLNADGSKGGHWTVAQTSDVAKSMSLYFEHITPEEWNVTMNMIYSDYVMVARKHSQDNAGFYADMAKAFLFDKDGGDPAEKLCRYYNYVVMAAK